MQKRSHKARQARGRGDHFAEDYYIFLHYLNICKIKKRKSTAPFDNFNTHDNSNNDDNNYRLVGLLLIFVCEDTIKVVSYILCADP